MTESGGERIAKRLARAGLCSRRDAERWIAEGRVVVNGKRLSSPAFNVAEHDRIAVDGKPIPAAEPARLWRYHKPRGLVTTARDPQGRPDRMAAYALASRDVPLRRPATADEVAAAVAFLAGPEASAISGVVLPVDGAAGAVDLPTLAFDPH